MKMTRYLCILVLILGVSSLSFAEETSRTAAVKELKGTVEVKTPKASWVAAQVGMILNQQDIIRTKKDSWAVINLDGTGETATVEIKQNSQMKLAELKQNKEQGTQNTLLDLALGEILIKAQKLHSEKSKFEVKTPTSIVGVRGTTFSVAVEAIE